MKNLDRRDFLRAAGVAALDSALRPGVRGANDRIAIGFIGIGVMGTENMRAAMAQPGVAVAALCDVYQPHLERAAAMARRTGHQPKETADFRQVLADPSIDAVCISTPDHWHPYMTVEACKAGKDVYVEKPVCVVIGEGQAMVAAARKYSRVVQAGTWQRSGAHFQKACELVRNGSLGKITVVGLGFTVISRRQVSGIRQTQRLRAASIGICGWARPPLVPSTRIASAFIPKHTRISATSGITRVVSSPTPECT